ncbi:MAG TPA: histidine kinase, partial [Bacteroidales bacterium]|nr:histidine kinase [Bacteroidales bacterium]
RLAMLLEAKGDLKQANFYLRQYSATRDSIFTLESHKQLAEMQALHESQRQQLEIERLEQDNEINAMRYDRSRYAVISLGGMMVIIILFAILLIRQNSIRNQQRVLENQQKLFRSQMNPHFIFNSLTNIQHYIFSKDSYTAGKYLAIFAKLMRNILNNSRQERITLRNEVETIQQYLDLQKLRMDEKLEYSLEVDEDLDQEIVEIPPMLAQPFIENAIEHGLRNKEGAGILSIRIMKNGKSLIYEIEDNGVGRKKAAEYMEKRHRDHQSMAVSLTRSRLQSLWGRKKVKALKIIDLMDAEGNARGTRVLLKVPGF